MLCTPVTHTTRIKVNGIRAFPLHSVGQIEADLYTSIKGFNTVHDREKTS